MLTPRNEAGWLYSNTTVDGQYLTCNIGGIITYEKFNRLGYVVNGADPSQRYELFGGSYQGLG